MDANQRESMGNTTVLQNLSPERTNRQPMLPPPLPLSTPSSPAPSVGSPQRAHLFQDPFLSSRRGSDVQGKVAQFNNLSRSNSEKKQELEKALQRARLAREQAENENETLRAQINEFVEREKKVGLRLEDNMEENEKLRADARKLREKYERAKEALLHSKDRFREELRRMKGAELKADSNQLAAQQALQSERQVIKSLETELKLSRDKSDRFEKEAFATQIKLLEMDEQLTNVQQQMKMVEEERNLLKTSLKEEEVARIAAEGRIPLPVCSTPDEFSSPRKHRESQLPTPKGKRLSKMSLADPFGSDVKKRDEEMASLKRQLEIETLSRKSAEDLIHFMQLECQLRRCSCRLAEAQGVEYVCDEHFYNAIEDLQEQYDQLPASKHADHEGKGAETASTAIVPPSQSLIDAEDEVEFSPETGTFRTVKSPQKRAVEAMLPPQTPVDVFSPNTTVIAAQVQASTGESPSMLASSELMDSVHKLSIDACQILPAVPVEQFVDSKEEDAPGTPKVHQPRSSDADLLSFTPFTLPSLSSQQSASNTSFQAPEPSIGPIDRGATIFPPQAESKILQREVLQREEHQEVPQQEAYVRPTSQHSSSYPPIQHNPASTHRVPPPQSRSTSSQSHRHHNSSHSAESRKAYVVQTITTTTTIPLAEEPTTPTAKTLPQTVLASSPSAPAGLGFTPGTTKSREEALACIRSWRKGNAEAAMANKDTNAKLNNGHSSGSSTGSTNSTAKPRSRSVVLAATPGRRKLVADRDVSAPVRI